MTHDDNEKVAHLCDRLKQEDNADASFELACALAELLKTSHLALRYQKGFEDVN